MQCASCGRDNPPGVGFCGGCGAKLTLPEAVSPAPPGTPSPSAPAPPSYFDVMPPERAGSNANTANGAGNGPDASPPSNNPPQPNPAPQTAYSPQPGYPPQTNYSQQPGSPYPPPPGGTNYGAQGAGYAPPSGNAPQGNYPPPTGAGYPPPSGNANVPHAPASIFEAVNERVGAFAGVDKIEGFNAQEMFSAVLSKRTDEDAESLFAVGTPLTTPPLSAVSSTWPKPWLFFKTLTLSLIVYFGFMFAFNQFQNLNIVPGLLIVGSFAVPLSMVIFYFEMNVPQNVSIFQVAKMMLVGGILSLIATLMITSLLDISANSGLTVAIIAGTTEEIGKLVALFLVAGQTRYRWTLNGLLLGGAVGAGFAGFESAGYALRVLLATHDTSPVYQTILLRGLLSPGGHVAWAALYGAALWKVKGDRPFSFGMLQDMRFLRVFGLAMALHITWDVPLSGVLDLIKDFALVGVGLVAILAFVQDGLRQIREAQAESGGTIGQEGQTALAEASARVGGTA